MSRRVRLRPLARQDLVKIWQHIAEHDPAAADRFIDHLTRRFDDLLAFPELGAAVPALGQGLRRHVVGRYLIFYEPDDVGILVQRVLHGARELDDLI